MKKYLISLFISLVLFFVFFSIIDSTYPINIDKLQEVVNTLEIKRGEENRILEYIDELFESGLIFSYLSSDFLVAIIVLLFAIWSVSVFIFMVADKLFFKKIDEPVKILPAIRRGFFVVLVVIGFILMRFKYIEIDLLFVILLIILIIDRILTQKVNYIKKKM